MKPVLLITLLFISANQFVLAQPDPTKSAGFRGFRLGMKAVAVRALIDTTQFRYEPAGDSVWTQKWLGTITVTPMRVGTDSSQRAASQLGCDPEDSTRCEEFANFELYMYNGTLYQIDINSKWHDPRYGILGWSWCNLAEKVISLRYGKPTAKNQILRDLEPNSYGQLPSSLYTFAGWRLPPAKVSTKQFIKIFFYVGSKQFYSNIMIWDNSLRDKANAVIEAASAAANDRYFKELEEERQRQRAKAKSDF